MNIAINGFGRIGRLVFRILIESPGVNVVAINDLTDNETLAHLLKHDSAQGPFAGEVKASESSIVVNGRAIHAFSERDPANLPWAELNVDLVLECTGIFRTEETAGKHIQAGAGKVLLSAPAKSEGIQTIVLGVNHEEIDLSRQLFSCASCTTNCTAPVVKVMHESWGIVNASLTTVHAYTADQRLQDAPHSDLRRARAAAVNIVPTSTGAASAVSKVFPAVKGKINALAIRVPVIAGSIIELTCWLEKRPSNDEINAVFKRVSETSLKGILQYSEEELVSSDIVGNPYSSIFDSKLTSAQGNMVRVAAWYDNEAGYANRLADLALKLA